MPCGGSAACQGAIANAACVGQAALGLAIRSASGVCQEARPMTAALFVLPWWLVVWLALGACATYAASAPASQPAEVWPVEMAFREAI